MYENVLREFSQRKISLNDALTKCQELGNHTTNDNFKEAVLRALTYAQTNNPDLEFAGMMLALFARGLAEQEDFFRG